MGMFDYLRCEMPLPMIDGMPDPGNRAFQTKDTPVQYMCEYTIKRDGTLAVKLWNEINIPTVVLEDYHGDIRFYASGTNGEWWEYIARFTDGKCVRIKPGDYKLPWAVRGT